MVKLMVSQCSFGRGVTTCFDILEHEEIIRFSGPILLRHQLPVPLVPENDHYLQIGMDTFIGPSGEVDDYVNHSCEPNAKVIIETDVSARLIALRTIGAGESIVYDYSTTMVNAPCKMQCSCGAQLCRGEVTDFWLLPVNRQHEYMRLGMVPDYLLAEHWQNPAHIPAMHGANDGGHKRYYR